MCIVGICGIWTRLFKHALMLSGCESGRAKKTSLLGQAFEYDSSCQQVLPLLISLIAALNNYFMLKKGRRTSLPAAMDISL